MSVPTVTVGIIDYGAGNIRSIINSLKHIGSNVVVVSDVSLLMAVGQSALALLRSLHSHVQALSELGISIRNIQPHSNR